MSNEITKTFKKKLNKVTSELEKEGLITEAIDTIITIARLNPDDKKAFELINSQFIVIFKQDLSNEEI
jgi:hypothetical protein